MENKMSFVDENERHFVENTEEIKDNIMDCHTAEYKSTLEGKRIQ